MARAQATDPLHNFRYHARAGAVAGLAGTDVLQPGGAPSPGVGDSAEAGFSAITTPEVTVESAEYREGTQTYTMKFPGIPTTNELTFSRGVSRRDTAFFGWLLAAAEGREYRADVTLFHAHREGRSYPFARDTDFADANVKRYVCENAFPVRVKLAADLDASTSDVSISEMDVAFEHAYMILGDGTRVGA